MRLSIVTPILCLLLLSVFTASTLYSETDQSDRRQMIKLCRQYLKQAVAHLDEGDYETAIPLLDSVLICDPKNPDGYYYLGKIQIILGDTAVAVEKLSLGVSKAPMSSRLKLLLARVKLQMNQLDESRLLIDKVLTIKPRHSEALFLKGLILTAQSDTALAVEQYRKAIEFWQEKVK